MHIQREVIHPHTITAYDETSLVIQNISYRQSLIVSSKTIISPWLVSSLNDLTVDTLAPFFSLQPEIIIIGHHSTNTRLNEACLQFLSHKGIGFEVMQQGAACRTFNLLLAEGRDIVAGFIMG